jgi:hypothetical protein
MCALLLNSPVIAALVAGLSGMAAVWLGLRRFRSEKWWERKAATYTAIIETLHILQELENERPFTGFGWPEDNKQEHLKKYMQAKGEIEKYADLGSYIVTEKTTDLLRNLFKALGPAGSLEIAAGKDWRDVIGNRLGHSAQDNCGRKD